MIGWPAQSAGANTKYFINSKIRNSSKLTLSKEYMGAKLKQEKGRAVMKKRTFTSVNKVDGNFHISKRRILYEIQMVRVYFCLILQVFCWIFFLY